MVLLDLRGGEYFALNELGTKLWNGLNAGTSVEEIATAIAAEYDVSLDNALEDLLALVNDLVAKGLLLPGGPR